MRGIVRFGFLAFAAALLPGEALGEVLYRDALLEISGSGLRRARSCEIAILPSRTLGERPPRLVIALEAAKIDEIAIDVGDRAFFDEVVLVRDNQRRALAPLAGGAAAFSRSDVAAALRSGEPFFLTAKTIGGGAYVSSRYEGIDFDLVLARIGEACPFDAEALMSDTRARQRVEAGLGLGSEEMRQIRRALAGRPGTQPAGPLQGAERERLRQYAAENGFPISRYLAGAIVDDLLKKAPKEPPSPPPAPLPPKRFDVYRGVDFDGSDLGTFLSGKTLDSCTAACVANPGCRALTYNVNRSSCFLKSGIGTPVYDEAAISAAIEGTVVRRPKPGMRMDENWDYPGGDFDDKGIRPVGLEKCKAMCAGDDRCRAFSHVMAKQWCWLKYHAGPGVSKPGIVSGLKLGGG